MVITEVDLMSGFQADSILLQQVYTNYHLMFTYNVLYIVVIVFVVFQLFPKTEIGLMRYEVKRRVTTFYFDEVRKTYMVLSLMIYAC